VSAGGSGFPITLRASAISGGGVNGSGPAWDISYCVIDQNISVGAPFGGCINCDPGFIGSGYSTDSSTLPIENQFHMPGSRPPRRLFITTAAPPIGMTIGFTGGPFYNPSNFTNTNPMVYLLTGTPLAGKELIFSKGTNKHHVDQRRRSGWQLS